jgi:hypothetical protein
VAVSAGLLVFCLAMAPARATDDAGGFTIRAASTELLHGVYYLNASMDLDLSRDAIHALKNGVPLTVELQIKVIHHRAWLWDTTVAHLAQRYQIRFHALSRQFIVRNLNSGVQRTYATYRAAIRQIDEVRDLPVIDASLLASDAEYKIRIRAVLDIDDFPGPLQLIGSLFSGWALSSDWYQWVLRA